MFLNLIFNLQIFDIFDIFDTFNLFGQYSILFL